MVGHFYKIFLLRAGLGIGLTIGLAFSGPNKMAKVLLDFDLNSTPLDSVPLGKKGDVVKSTIIAENLKNLTGFHTCIQYDTTLLRYSKAKYTSDNSHNFMLQKEGGKVSPPLVLTKNGKINFMAGLIKSDEKSAPDGDGVLLEIHFEVISEKPQKPLSDCGFEISSLNTVIDTVQLIGATRGAVK